MWETEFLLLQVHPKASADILQDFVWKKGILSTAAGINMFTQCVAMEQASQSNPVEIVAFDPGMVDTELQAEARGKSAEEFVLSGVFREAYESGQLRSPGDVAKDIFALLEESRGKHM